MNETVAEWFQKAEGDFRTARRELEALDGPNYDAVCFHAQQCIEKLLKAVLIRHATVPPRIHHLERLYDLVRVVRPDVLLDCDELRFLNGMGVAVRYPGETADQQDAMEAMACCRRLRDVLKPVMAEPSEEETNGGPA